MALAGVLSALKEIILDELPLPDSEPERLEYYCRRFSSLSAEEREDLAKIKPQYFRIYTSTIFSGERSTLVRHFPVSFALLQNAWPETYGEKFDRFAFVKKLHKARPWNTNTTKGLAENFVRHLQEDRPELAHAVPFLSETAEMELLHLASARAKEQKDVLAGAYSLEQMAAISVGELMELGLFKPRCVRGRRFEYDVVTLRQSYFDREGQFTPLAEKREVCALVARNKFARMRWVEVARPVFDFLAELEPYEQRSMEELAGAFAESADPELGEAELFQAFADTLFKLSRAGTVVVGELR